MTYDPKHSAQWIAALARRFVVDESGCAPGARNPLVLFADGARRLLIEVTPSLTLSPEVASCGVPAVVAATYVEAQPHLERAGFVRGLQG